MPGPITCGGNSSPKRVISARPRSPRLGGSRSSRKRPCRKRAIPPGRVAPRTRSMPSTCQQDEPVAPLVARDHGLLQPQPAAGILQIPAGLLHREASPVGLLELAPRPLGPAAAPSPAHVAARASCRPCPPTRPPYGSLRSRPPRRWSHARGCGRRSRDPPPRGPAPPRATRRRGARATRPPGRFRCPSARRGGPSSTRAPCCAHRRSAGRAPPRLLRILDRGPVAVAPELRPLAPHDRHPAADAALPVPFGVGEPPIHRLAGRLRHPPLGGGQSLPDGANAQGGGMPHTVHPIDPRRDPLGVDRLANEACDARFAPIAPDLPLRPATAFPHHSPAGDGPPSSTAAVSPNVEVTSMRGRRRAR
jgi:hypothetical protein